MRKLMITSGLVVGIFAIAGAIDLIPRASLLRLDWLTGATVAKGLPPSPSQSIVPPKGGDVSLMGDFDVAAPENREDVVSDECEAPIETQSTTYEFVAVGEGEATAPAIADDVDSRELIEEAKKLRAQAEKLEKLAEKLLAEKGIKMKLPRSEAKAPDVRVYEVPAEGFEFDFDLGDLDIAPFLPLVDGGMNFQFFGHDQDLVQKARELASKDQSNKKVQEEWRKLGEAWGKRLKEGAKARTEAQAKWKVQMEKARKDFKRAIEERQRALRETAPRAPRAPKAPLQTTRSLDATNNLEPNAVKAVVVAEVE